jgi:hypothetical protein
MQKELKEVLTSVLRDKEEQMQLEEESQRQFENLYAQVRLYT